MDKTITYLREVRAELEKVEWPNKTEVVKLTLTVVIITVAVGAYVGALDYTFARALEWLLSL